jgi:hypothetical protein
VGDDEGTVALLRRLTAALEAMPVERGRSPIPSVPGRRGAS